MKKDYLKPEMTEVAIKNSSVILTGSPLVTAALVEDWSEDTSWGSLFE